MGWGGGVPSDAGPYIILQVIQYIVYWISNKVGLKLLKAALVWSLPVKRVLSSVHSILGSNSSDSEPGMSEDPLLFCSLFS